MATSGDTGTGTGEAAEAVIPTGSTAGATLDIGDEANVYNTINYSTFLAVLRNTVSTHSSDGNLQTQNSGGNNTYFEARFRIGDDSSPSLTLVIRAHDLYVVAYRTRDHSFSLRDGNYQGFQNGLGFGGNYIELTNQARRELNSIPISHDAVTGAVRTLASTTLNNYQNANFRRNIARSLQQLIQLTSEAARFNDIESRYRRALGTPNHVEGLSAYDQDLEHSWSRLSSFFYQLNHNSGTATAPNINGTVFTNQAQVRRAVFVLQGSTTGYLPENPRHDEL